MQEIVVGFRTPKGELTTLQSFKTMQIPRMVRGKPDAWDPQICLAWGDQFLTWLRAHVANANSDDVPRVWRVTFTPRAGVTLALLDDAGVTDVIGGEERHGFLPTWYWEEVKKGMETIGQVGTDL
jgi:RAT1-interacting protein